jgi:hypothetical protein
MGASETKDLLFKDKDCLSSKIHSLPFDIVQRLHNSKNYVTHHTFRHSFGYIFKRS